MPSDISVRFVYIEDRDALNSVRVVNGQIIALTEESGYFYDMNDTRYEVAQAASGDATTIPYGEIDSISLSLGQRLTATIPTISSVVDGTCVYLVNVISDVTAAFSLNVSSTGDKPVYDTSGGRATRYIKNSGAFFVYNTSRDAGGCWDMLVDPRYTNGDAGQGYSVCTTASGTSAKAASISNFILSDGGALAIKFQNAVTGAATLNISNTGAYPILYQSNALNGTEISAGSTALLMYQNETYNLLAVDDVIGTVQTLLAALEYKDIYWCTYGVTTFQEIIDARDSGKLIALKYNQVTYLMTQSLSGKFVFAPPMYRANIYLVECNISDVWSEVEFKLATKAQLDEKYTLPQDGIPKTDLAFIPAEVDPTFLVRDDAPESVLTGQRFQQLEEMAISSDYTVEEHFLDLQEESINPDTGIEWEDSPINGYDTFTIPFNSDVIVTFGDPNYEWFVYAYSTLNSSQTATHPGTILGYVNATIPLHIEFKPGDKGIRVALHRLDDAYIYDSESEYILRAVKVHSKPTASAQNTSKHTTRSNSSLVDEIVAVATSYYNGRADTRPDTTLNMEYGEPTILDTAADTNKIDDATFIGLVLRGLPYGKTSYYTYEWQVPSYWTENNTFSWAFNPSYYANKQHSYDLYTSPVRTAAQLAQLLVEQGRVIPIDTKLCNLEPGDLVFYAKKDIHGVWNEPNAFMNVDHVAICTSKTDGSSIIGWDVSKFPYCHKIIHASNQQETQDEPVGCFYDSVVEVGYTGTADFTTNNYRTICLICRPDLGTLSPLVSKGAKILPANPLTTGTPGQMMYDDTTLYICVGPNTWKTVSLT